MAKYNVIYVEVWYLRNIPLSWYHASKHSKSNVLSFVFIIPHSKRLRKGQKGSATRRRFRRLSE